MLVITRRDAVNIPWAFIAFLLWIGRNLPDFKSPKQALINAFNHYVCSSHLLDISLGAELQSKDSVSQWEKQMGDGVTGRSLCELQGVIVGLVFLFPSDIGFVGYYLFRCFYMLFCEISPLQGCFVLYPIIPATTSGPLDRNKFLF